MKRTVLIISFLITLSTASALGQASLTAIHGIPDLPAPVDVFIDGSPDPAFSFDFGETFGPAELPEGPHELEIQLNGETVFTKSVELESGGNYTVIAHLTFTGDPGSPGLALSCFDNNVDELARPFNSRVTLRHTANAPSVAVEVLRYWFIPSVVFPQFSNDSDGSPSSVSFEQWLGPISVNLLAGGEQVFTTGGFQTGQDTSLIAYAVGDFFSGSFQIILQSIGLD